MDASVHERMLVTSSHERLHQSIMILDENGYLSTEETEALEQSLTDFRDHTGIIPAVELTEDATWQQDYITMERFAYNEYICHFDDEYHLLVVYGYGDKNPQTGFCEFHYLRDNGLLAR